MRTVPISSAALVVCLLAVPTGAAEPLLDPQKLLARETFWDTDVQSEPIKGPLKVLATVGRDGVLTLAVGEQALVKGKAPGPVPGQPAEDFCVGHDNGQPVADYSKGKPFEGKITDLKVTSN